MHINSKIVKYSFFHRTAMIWNTLDSDIVNAPGLTQSYLLDAYLLSFVRGRTSM